VADAGHDQQGHQRQHQAKAQRQPRAYLQIFHDKKMESLPLVVVLGQMDFCCPIEITESVAQQFFAAQN
jgi:hypothetical protein